MLHCCARRLAELGKNIGLLRKEVKRLQKVSYRRRLNKEVSYGRMLRMLRKEVS